MRGVMVAVLVGLAACSPQVETAAGPTVLPHPSDPAAHLLLAPHLPGIRPAVSTYDLATRAGQAAYVVSVFGPRCEGAEVAEERPIALAPLRVGTARELRAFRVRCPRDTN